MAIHNHRGVISCGLRCSKRLTARWTTLPAFRLSHQGLHQAPKLPAAPGNAMGRAEESSIKGKSLPGCLQADPYQSWSLRHPLRSSQFKFLQFTILSVRYGQCYAPVKRPYTLFHLVHLQERPSQGGSERKEKRLCFQLPIPC